MSADSIPQLNGITWRNFILNAARSAETDEHPWICYTYSEKRERLISLLTPEKYRELSSKNSVLWGQQCEKIPLAEIIRIAEDLAIDHLQTPDNLSRKVYLDDTFKVEDFGKFVKEHIQELKNEYEKIPKALQALTTMCERSALKKQQLKTQGLWARFKLLLYSWFCGYVTPETAKLKEQTLKPVDQIISEMLANVSKTLKDRVIINIEDFIEREHIRSDVNWEEAIQKPQDIHKKWSVKYAADKLPKVTEHSDIQRKRINALYNFWKAMDEAAQQYPKPSSIGDESMEDESGLSS